MGRSKSICHTKEWGKNIQPHWIWWHWVYRGFERKQKRSTRIKNENSGLGRQQNIIRRNYQISETVLWKAAQGNNICSFASRGYLIFEALMWNQMYCFALLYLHIWHGWFYEVIFGLQLPLGNSWPTNFAKFEEQIIRHKLYHSRTKFKQ